MPVLATNSDAMAAQRTSNIDKDVKRLIAKVLRGLIDGVLVN